MTKLYEIYKNTLKEENDNTIVAAQRLAKSEGPNVEKSLEDFIEQSQKLKKDLEDKIVEQLPSKKTFVSISRNQYPEIFKILDKMSNVTQLNKTNVGFNDKLMNTVMYSAAWKNVVDYYRENGLTLNISKVPVDTDRDHEFRVKPEFLSNSGIR